MATDSPPDTDLDPRGGYRVRAEDLFEGPLDLLLHLVRRHEVDVREVGLSAVLRDFQTHLDVLQFLDLGFIGDFLVTAAALIEIKSREVLPSDEEDTDEAETAPDDTGGGLVQRLLIYKRYKEAANRLEENATSWLRRYPRLTDERPRSDRDPARDFIVGVELWDLVGALARVLESKEVVAYGTIELDKTPMAVHQQRIRDRIAKEGRVAFSAFFETANERGRIVGVFLAILELLRHHGYRAEQTETHREIWVLPPAENVER